MRRRWSGPAFPIPGLQARDGLAAINGSNLLTAMSAIHIYDMERFLKQAEIAAAMSIEALLGNLKPYNTNCTNCAASRARSPRRQTSAR